MNDLTDEFRHRTTLEVRFRDIDAFRHVNNAAFFTYIEQARIRYLIDTLHLEAVERLPLILAAVQIDFRSPILFGQEVEIGTRVDWIGNTSFSVSHVLRAANRLAAEARTVLVSYDYATERPIRVPDDWRAAFANWEGRNLARPERTEPAAMAR
ncbi:MAG: acyl-CoA thioesterase [Candidatus Limnocylindria bacterium]